MSDKIPDSIREAVARALYEEKNGDHNGPLAWKNSQKLYLSRADTALSAALEHGFQFMPEGWVAVPAKGLIDFLKAAQNVVTAYGRDNAAAPKDAGVKE